MSSTTTMRRESPQPPNASSPRNNLATFEATHKYSTWTCPPGLQHVSIRPHSHSARKRQLSPDQRTRLRRERIIAHWAAQRNYRWAPGEWVCVHRRGYGEADTVMIDVAGTGEGTGKGGKVGYRQDKGDVTIFESESDGEGNGVEGDETQWVTIVY